MIRREWGSGIVVLVLLALLSATAGAGDVATSVSILPDRDNTLYEFGGGTTANDVGDWIFAGSGGPTRPEKIKRAILYFDVAAHVPPGATITGVSLGLRVTKTRDTSARQYDLHRIQQDWGGSGLSNAPGNEGVGDTAMTGDGTWRYTFYRDTQWNNLGGDYDAEISASTNGGPVNSTTTWSSDIMVSDVQTWLDTPETNFGWLIKGLEDPNDQWAIRRWGSMENNNESHRPNLTIDFTIPSELACRFGTVDLANSGPADVLTVNGSVGNGLREVMIGLNEAISIDMVQAPAGPNPGPFVMYLWLGVPDSTTITALPKNLGTLCFPMFVFGGTPKPFKTWNNIGRYSKLGQPDFPSTPAPSNVLNYPPGSSTPATATIQALILDDGSAADAPASITNAVILQIQ